MSTAPVVENLNDLISTIGQSVAPQKAQFDTEIAQNDASGAAQVAGLDAKKNTAFDDITQQAQNKGMFFSGFSPDAQAKYTAGTYLPALAALQSTIASTRNNLLTQKNALDTNVFNTAYSTQTGEKNNLFTYDQSQDSYANQEKLQQEQLTAQAQQAAADRASQYGIAAMQEAGANSRAASSASSKAPTAQDLQTSLSQDLQGAFNGFASDPKGYTEKTIIPQLVQAYPELKPSDITSAVYSYRKALYGQ